MELEERDFFKEPLSEAEIRALAGTTNIAELFARRSPAVKQMGLAGRELSEDEMVGYMLQEPRLIRRPLVRMGGKLLVGASPKVIEAALQDSS